MKDNLIIFDMDGTLIDSSEDITISVNHVRSHFGLPPLSKTSVVDVINGDRSKLAFGLYGIEEYTKEHRDIFETHYYEQCIKNTYLYDGIPDLLAKLKAKGFKMAVATNAYTKFAEKMLSHLGIDRYFVDIVGSCRVNRPKPEPDMIHHIMNNHNPLNRTVMVGDNHTDVFAALNAEIEMIFAGWGFGKISDYNKVHFVAKTPYDIYNFLVY
ncbi:MAG: HAD-IA family hydrolase [Calditerrivibrio sp.]|nr:HAD-IA family hydrolase [Calditerrivibrio sp.]